MFHGQALGQGSLAVQHLLVLGDGLIKGGELIPVFGEIPLGHLAGLNSMIQDALEGFQQIGGEVFQTGFRLQNRGKPQFQPFLQRTFCLLGLGQIAHHPVQHIFLRTEISQDARFGRVYLQKSISPPSLGGKRKEHRLHPPFSKASAFVIGDFHEKFSAAKKER